MVKNSYILLKDGTYGYVLPSGDISINGVVIKYDDKLIKATLKEQSFLRKKPFGDTEAVIYGFEESQTNLNEPETNELGRTFRSSHIANKLGNGMIGSFLCVDVVTGNPIKVSAGKLNHYQRKELFDNFPKGAIIKYRSMTSGVKDAPRFARFYSFRAIEDMDLSLQDKVNDIINKINRGLI